MVEIAETNLNEGQKEAVTKIIQFLMSDKKEFCLSGAAGTGKTFMMKYVSSKVLLEYQRLSRILDIKPNYYNLAFTATTNKAAEVLSSSLGITCQTIHSYLSLRVFQNYKTGKEQLSTTGSTTEKSYTLLFIDEASMIDSELKKLINQFMNDSCKIIYVGDHNQLPPVNEDTSPIYGDESIDMAVLTQSMRNATQPALMDLCQQYRNTVETGIFSPIVSNKLSIESLDGPAAKKIIDELFVDEDVSCRILAHTNEKVIAYNEYIRQLRNRGSKWEQGENLVVSKPFTLPGGSVISAESDVIVLSVTDETILEQTSYGAFSAYQVTLSNGPMSSFTSLVPLNQEEYKDILNKASKAKDWTTFYSVKNKVADIRPRDASTVHKSQGSTYDSVIVDLDDIGQHWGRDVVARLLYVAVSRAKYKVYLKGNLPHKYGGPVL